MKSESRKLAKAAVFSLAGATLAIAWSGSGKDPMSYEHERGLTMFDKVTADIEKNYYDPNLHGLKWQSLKEDARQRIQSAHSNAEILTEIYALVDQLHDSHTVFIPPPHAATVRYGFNAKPFGNRIMIYEVKKGGPAERAGLEPGDVLFSVERFKAERSTWDQMMVFLRVINPRPSLELVVVRGNEQPRTIKIQPEVKQGTALLDLTKLDTIYQLIREEEKEPKPAANFSYPDSIGYVRWRSFIADPVPLQDHLLKQEKSNALILDLRGNPGGAVKTLVQVAGFFEPEPVVLYEAQGRKKNEEWKISPRHPTLSVPLFILVDSETASAGEIFARHFQSNGRAVVIGDQTSGRVAQARIFVELSSVDQGAPFGVEVDMARVVFPGGEDLEHRGVTPDKPCLPAPDDLSERRDFCRGLAIQLARAALKLPELSKDELGKLVTQTKAEEEEEQ